ncbi:hypothetical protein GCM10027176_82200 [Actinoallomurus bryophytorum]
MDLADMACLLPLDGSRDEPGDGAGETLPLVPPGRRISHGIALPSETNPSGANPREPAPETRTQVRA